MADTKISGLSSASAVADTDIIPIVSGGVNYKATRASLFTGTATILTNGASNKGLIIQGALGQTANLFEACNNSGTALTIINASGAIAIGTTSTTSSLEVVGTASSSTIPFVKVSGTTGTGYQIGIQSSVTIGTGSNQGSAASIYGAIAGANNQNGSTFGVWGDCTSISSAAGIGLYGTAISNTGNKCHIGVAGAVSSQNSATSSTRHYGAAFDAMCSTGTPLLTVGTYSRARGDAGTIVYGGYFCLAGAAGSTIAFGNGRPTDPPNGVAALAGDNGSSTADIFRCLDNGTTVFSVADGGAAVVALTNPASKGLVVKGATSQSANIAEFQNSSSTALTTITKDGYITAPQISSGGTTPLLIPSHSTTLTTDSDAATVTFNLATSNDHLVVLGGNRTLALSNDQIGQKFTLILQQDATGSRTVTWWSGISWAGGSVPTLTTTANKTDVFTFWKTGVGAYLGFVTGQNF